MRSFPAVLFAVLAAVSNALAVVLQRSAARTVPLAPGLRLSLFAQLLRRRAWLGGMAAVMAAACLQALALSQGAMAVVQPVFVLELPFALLLGGLILGRRVTGPAWRGAVCIAAGLGLALAAAAPTPGTGRPPADRWLLALVCCLALIGALAATALRHPEGGLRAACFGTTAAVGYALTAALMKDATHAWQDGGAGAFFLTWQTYGFAVVGVMALFLLENAMQSGPLTASQPALTLGDALVSLSLGITLYEERVRSGWWILPEAAGAALVLYGAVTISRVALARDLVTTARAGAD
ncbi:MULTISPECIES: DMT family transporter [Streptomyces]|uniref:DMT family transporter n=1 Tax=Streptomyces nondiastaticus TaxID=3154512 RepID=A0ABW6U3Z0_9ACTN|nr:DMT family transporter [Streptomyces sp. VNUA116]WKU43445.1 DMT family transporter [Streptomyces sp. VNUA116]